MGKKLFVGGLPYETNDGQLKELFAACGAVVSAKVIIDKATGKSKGFGFVEMTTDEGAKAATEKLNNSALGARRIFVNEARPMEPRPAGGFPRPSSGGLPESKPGFMPGVFPDKRGGFGGRGNFGPDKKSGGRGDYDKKGRGGRRGADEYDKKGGCGKGGKSGKGGRGERDFDSGYDGW